MCGKHRHVTETLLLWFVLLPLLFALILGCSDSDSTISGSDPFRGKPVNLTIDHKNTETGLTQPPSGSHSVLAETPVDIVASPGDGYVFSGWQLSGAGSLGDPHASVTTVTLSGDTVLKPLFKREVRLTIHIVPPSCGSTVPMPEKAISLGQEDTIELSALPGTGYYFSGWQGTQGCEITDSTASSTTAIISADCKITAEFEEDPVKFSGIVIANAYTATDSQTGHEKTLANLEWLEASSRFSGSPEEMTYHVYHGNNSDLKTLYRSENLKLSQKGVLKAELDIDTEETKTYFLVVAEDPQGNRNHGHRVASVVSSRLTFDQGGVPMDLRTLGADNITVSAEEKTVTLHGGDWRYLFPTGKNIALFGDDLGVKSVSYATFNNDNYTTIHYKDKELKDFVQGGRFQTYANFPDLNQLPAQTLQRALERSDLPAQFIRRLESAERSNTLVYINPAKTMILIESSADGVTQSRDGAFERTISLDGFGTLNILIDLTLGAYTDRVVDENTKEVEQLLIDFEGAARVHGVAKLQIDSGSNLEFKKERLVEKKFTVIYALGPVPVIQDFDFWIDAYLDVSFNEGTDLQITAGVKVDKGIHIGMYYERGKGWSPYYRQEHHKDLPLAVSGSAKTTTTLHLTPHVKTTFNKCATAEAQLVSNSKLFADFTAAGSEVMLTRCDFNSHAYMMFFCDFKPFGVILLGSTNPNSLWLFTGCFYSLPEMKMGPVQNLSVDEKTTPHHLRDFAKVEFVDGIKNPRRKVWWVLERLMPDGQMWVPVPTSRLLPDSETIDRATEPPYDRCRFIQNCDLYVDNIFPQGLYRIKTTGTTKGILGSLDTRVVSRQFRVYNAQ